MPEEPYNKLFFPLFFIGKSNRLLCLAREKLHIESGFFVGVWPCRSAVVLSSKWTWKSEHGVLGWKVRILSLKSFWISVVLQRHTIDFTIFFLIFFEIQNMTRKKPRNISFQNWLNSHILRRSPSWFEFPDFKT